MLGALSVLAQESVSDKKDLYPQASELIVGALAFAIVLVGFEIFVAALQAFIFAILSASYIGQAMAEEH